MSIRGFYPDVFPGTRIDFSNRSVVPSPVEFDRATTATYVDKDGVVKTAYPSEPRFSYDPETGESLGLLVEEARTNIIKSSSNFIFNDWHFTQCQMTPNAVLAPDGTQTAALIQQTNGTSTRQFICTSYSVPLTGSPWTASVYVKKFNYDYVIFGAGDQDSGPRGTRFGYLQAQLRFQFSTKTLSINPSTNWGGNVTDYGYEELPNGWFRLWVSKASFPRANYWGISVQQDLIGNTTLSGDLNLITGDSVSGVYVWGFQWESGAFKTSHIPTTTSAATRAADTFTAPIENFKSARVIFSSPSSNYNSISSPALTFSDSQNTSVPYTLELSGPRFVPTLVTKYNFIGQSYLSIPDYPTLASPSGTSSVAFNYDSSTGAMKLATSAGDDDTTSVVSLDEKYNIPAPAGYSLDTLVVGGFASIKEIYLWSKSLGADQLASVAKDLGAIGRPESESTGLQDDVLYDIADARPTLDLNFAERKNLSNSVNGFQLVTFGRTSAGTYVDEDGVVRSAAADEPRFDHDPATGDSLGLLVEEERMNLIPYSDQVINGLFIYGLTVIPFANIDPSELIRGTLLRETATGSTHMSELGSTIQNRTFSIFVKAAGRTKFRVFAYTSNLYASFSLTGIGSVISTNAGIATIKSYGNGWYRCSVYCSIESGTSIYFGPIADFLDPTYPGGFSQSYLGDGVSGIYVWGAQLEEGSFPTSYIPTPATFVSRSTSATYYDANGIIQTAGVNVARDDAYFPDADGVMRPAGLFLEGEGTNGSTFSSDASVWQNISGEVTNTQSNIVTAPDGTSEADNIYGASGKFTAKSLWGSTLNVPNNSYLVMSIFAKKVPSSKYEILNLNISIVGAGGPRLACNLTTGVVIPNAGVSGYSQKLPNGWYRFVAFVQNTTGSTQTWSNNNMLRIFATTSTSDPQGIGSGTGSTTDGVYVWGRQTEVNTSSYATSYIPTDATPGGVVRDADSSSSSTVIRKPDVASITGTNFSSWYEPNEGTYFVETNKVNATYGKGIIATYTGTAGNSQKDVFTADVNTTLQWYTPPPGQSIYSYPSPGFSGLTRIAGSYTNLSDKSLTTNGGSITSGNAGDRTSTITMTIGHRLSTNHLTGTISRVTYWPTRLPDATLQAITDPAIETWDLVFDSSLAPNGTCAIITNGTTTYTVDWGDRSPVQTITATGTFTAEHTYVVPKEYNVKVGVVSGAFRPYYNNNAYADQLVKIRRTPDGWVNTSTSGFGTNLTNAWYGANNLREIDRQTNTAGVTNFSLTWLSCSSLTSFPLLDTSSGTVFQQAWKNCSSLTSFPLINSALVTNFNETWRGCSSLTSFPLINTSSGTSFAEAWSGCSSLTSFPLINTAAGTSFFRAWQDCSSLTSFPLINTAAGTIFSIAWYNCSGLTSFPLIDTAAGTLFSSAWEGCSSLTSFPLINTAAGTNFSRAWYNCSSLTSFPLIDTSSGTNFQQTWYNCSSLTSFPANFFDTWIGTPENNCFFNTWVGCSSLTATSVENIYNSISVSAASTTPPASGKNIDVTYKVSTGTPDITVSAIDLTAKGWTPTLNNVAQTNPYSFASLDLDFATNKTLDDNVSGTNLITFSRGSIGTYVDGSGVIQTASNDQPRFDHDPVTGESLGLLVEESRTNVVTNSTSPSWNLVASSGTGTTPIVTLVSDAAPDGSTNSAQRFQFDRGTGNTENDYSLVAITTSAASVLHSVSVWMRSNDSNTYTLIFYDAGGAKGEEIIVTPSWKRYVLDASTSYKNSNLNPYSTPNLIFGLRNNPTSPNYFAGNNNSQTADILAWGPQIEAGSFATSYIPTAGAPGGVTRVADEASITGTNFSSWYEQSEGTIVINFITDYIAGVNSPIGSLNNGNDSQRISLRPRNTIYGNQTVASLTISETPSGILDKIAWSFDSSGLSLISGSNSDLYTLPLASQVLTQLEIGKYETGPYGLINGTISRLAYWPKRLTDTSLQYLTQ